MKAEGAPLRRLLELRKELRLAALGEMVQRKAALPATQEELQAQLVNLQDAFRELVSLLKRVSEDDPSTLHVLQEIERVLGKFETPPGGAPADEVFQRAMKSLLDKKGSATVAGEVFEAAMGQIPRRRPGRPTDQEAKAEAELAARLQKLYRRKR